MSLLFEASVGGGIPVIRPMLQCLAANEFNEICGILNGTTNYILTQMIHNGSMILFITASTLAPLKILHSVRTTGNRLQGKQTMYIWAFKFMYTCQFTSPGALSISINGLSFFMDCITVL